MTSSSARTSSLSRGALAALIASLSAVGPFSIDAYLPSMAEIQKVMHASPYIVQLTLTAYMGPFAIMTLWHGAISDAVGRRVVVLWGMALFALASLACAFAQTIEMLLIFRVLQGATAGAGMVVGRAIVRDRFHGADAQRLMSQISLAFAMAPAVAPVIGGWLQAGFGWRSVFVFLVFYSATVWLLCRSSLPETLARELRRPLHPGYLVRSYWNVLTSLRFLSICTGSTFCFAGIFIYVTAAPVFLMRHLGVSSTGFLWLFGPITCGMAAGAWISGRVAGRLLPGSTLAWALGLMGLAAAGNLWFHSVRQPTLPWSVVPLFFYAIGMALAFPTLVILALDLFPNQRGLAASCQGFIQTGGGALVALVAPFVWDSARFLAIAQVGSAAIAAACVVAYRWRHKFVAQAQTRPSFMESEPAI